MLWQPGEYRSCTTPRLVRDVGPVSCGVCANCGKSRMRDWIGRNLIEAETASYTLFATLTIGGDRLYDGSAENVRSWMFHPDDVRAYLKRMRKFLVQEWRGAGRSDEARRAYLHRHDLAVLPDKPPRLRYFLTGEQGDARQRCHYHLLLHFYGCKGPADLQVGRFMFHGKYPPGVVVNACIVDPAKPRWDFRKGSGVDWVKSDRTYWPFGLVRYQEFVPEHAYYVAAYVTKGVGEGQVMRPGISRAPLLGAHHLERLARQYVEQWLAPQAKTYCVPRNEGYRHHNPEYWLSEAACRHLCRTFVRLWGEACKVDPTRPEQYPTSELVDECVAWDEAEAARKRAVKDGVRSVRDQVEDEFAGVERRQRNRARKGLRRDLSDVKFDWASRLKGEFAGPLFELFGVNSPPHERGNGG